MNNNRRVVITGMGAITPLGNDVETFWSNLKNGVSGIHTIESFDTSAYDCRIGGEVRGFDPKTVFKNPKDVRRTDRFASWRWQRRKWQWPIPPLRWRTKIQTALAFSSAAASAD